MSIQNALTVDVEDYFQVSAFAKSVAPNDWDNFSLRVEQNTHKLMDLFDERQIKATFFVLGWVAERANSLILEIAKRFREIEKEFGVTLLYSNAYFFENAKGQRIYISEIYQNLEALGEQNE